LKLSRPHCSPCLILAITMLRHLASFRSPLLYPYHHNLKQAVLSSPLVNSSFGRSVTVAWIEQFRPESVRRGDRVLDSIGPL